MHYRLVLLSFVIFFASACPKNIPPPDNALQTVDELRAAIDTRATQVKSARFKEVVVDYFGEEGRVKVRQLILVKDPAYLRVQTRVPGTDEILSLLVSDGETFAMHRRDTNDYYKGTATPENIARLLPVNLSARDVGRIMLGSAPWDRFDVDGGKPQMEWDRKVGTYRYWVTLQDGGTLEMWVRPTDYAVEEVRETGSDDKVVYRYETNDWKTTQGVALPDYRRFVWPRRNLDFSMDVGETELNVELPEMLFELAPPPGSQVHDVDRLDG